MEALLIKSINFKNPYLGASYMFLHTDTDGVFGHNTLSDVNENFKVQDEGNAVGTASPGTLQACKDACDADANCNSFAYSASSTWCYLKDKCVTADAPGGGDSNYKAYYKPCTSTVATTTTTTTLACFSPGCDYGGGDLSGCGSYDQTPALAVCHT